MNFQLHKNNQWIARLVTSIRKTDDKIRRWTMHVIRKIEKSYSDEKEKV